MKFQTVYVDEHLSYILGHVMTSLCTLYTRGYKDVQFTFHVAVQCRVINNRSRLNHFRIKGVSLIMLYIAEVYVCPEIILACNN
jgi:hypothetical protein